MNLTIGSPRIGWTFGFSIFQKPYRFTCALLRYPNPFQTGRNWAFHI